MRAAGVGLELVGETGTYPITYEPMFIPISSTNEALTPASFIVAIWAALGGPPLVETPAGGPDIVDYCSETGLRIEIECRVPDTEYRIPGAEY